MRTRIFGINQAQFDGMEQLKSAYQIIKTVLEKDEGQDSAALMIQHQFKVFLRRKRMQRVVQARKKTRK